MRRPLLLAAAIAVTGGSIGLIALSEQRRTPSLESRTQFRTMDAALPSMPTMSTNVPVPPAPPAPPPPDRAPSLPKIEYEPAAQGGIIRETAPRIAYSYGYRFRIPSGALAGLQERHLQLCLELGEARCRVVSMRRSEPRTGPPVRDHGYGGGAAVEQPGAALELQVATALAHRFGQSLGAAAGAAGAETVDRQIAAEDISRQMIDSEARIRTRETLIRRLSALLETRSGNIQQAVEAERAINQAQEELDAARTWLAEMRGRVTMSRIAIAYEATGAPASAVRERNPFASSLAQVATLTARSLAALLLVFGVLLPWGAIILLVVLAARWHRRRRDGSEPAAVAPSQPSW
ncbi:MAG TPA: DUF4349 domain-containing protein [Allosphingosinicella sp.]|jgi:hypothetical protein